MNPRITLELCTRCGLCSKDCPTRAIDPATMEIRAESCMGCGHCLAICPANAVGQLDGPDTLPDLAPGVNAAQESFERLVTMRRSMRHYKAEALAPADLDRLLELVRFAPTGTHSQAVELTVLASRDRVQGAVKVALEFYRRLAGLAASTLVLPFAALFGGKTLARKLKGYKLHLDRAGLHDKDILAHNAPALMIFHTPRGSSTPVEDANIWAATATLHAESMGLGTCWIGFLTRALNMSSRLKAQVGIPRDHRVHTCFALGYPAHRYQRPAPRKPAAVRVHR